MIDDTMTNSYGRVFEGCTNLFVRSYRSAKVSQ